MSLFAKNPNEKAFSGGKKNYTDVIKNTGPGDLLIWRQPEEDFNTNSTIIVMPGESAIFINQGNIEQVFESGTYKLDTNNYPFISRLRNAFSGGISTFNSVVYFVKTADSQELRWGTDSPILVRDKVWGIRTDAKVRASYKVRIINPAKFLQKLVGSNINFQRQADLFKYFDGEFQGKIKSSVSKFLNSLEQELIGIEAYMDDLSNNIDPFIDEALFDYGLKCVKFTIAGLDIDATKYDAIDESQIESVSKVKLAQGDKGVMDVLGTNWSRQQSANILGNLSTNPGSGGMAAMGAGIGMAGAATGAFASMSNQIFSESTANPQQPAVEDPMETLTKLKKMLDAGLIEQSDFDTKKTEILSRL